MIQVSVEDLQRDLPAYLQRVEAGKTVVIGGDCQKFTSLLGGRALPWSEGASVLSPPRPNREGIFFKRSRRDL